MAATDESGKLMKAGAPPMSPRDRADAARKAADAAATAAAAAEAAAAAAERALAGIAEEKDDAPEPEAGLEEVSAPESLPRWRPRWRPSAVTTAAEKPKVAVAGGNTESVPLMDRPFTRRVVAAAVLVLVAVATVGNVLLFREDRAFGTEQDSRIEFIQAAKQGVVNMTTIDFNNAQADVQRVIDGSTGEFRADFEGRAADFIDIVVKSAVSTKGEIQNAGIERIDDDGSGVVLVASTSKVTNSAGAEDETRAWRLRVTLTRADDQLKMSKVEFVP